MENVPTTRRDDPLITRRRLLGGLVAGAAAMLGGGAYATQIEPFWLDLHEVPVRLDGLPGAFDGFRIAHLTDLHASDIVPMRYLRRVMDAVNAACPDAVVITGDFVTHDPAWVGPVCEVLAELDAPIYASLGNHDYSRSSKHHFGPTPVADALQRELDAIGALLLRNRAVRLKRGEAGLWIVGFEDAWSGHFQPAEAMGQVYTDEPSIALVHNPDAALLVEPLAPALLLCGHTHGGQVRIPFVGAPILPVQNRQYDQGWFKLAHAQMYISRGVGYLKQIRFGCRPEVPVYRLVR